MEESKQILMAITELQANVRHLSEQMKEIGKIGQNVVEATQSVKSAHNRIDDMKEDFEGKLKAQKEDYEERLRNQKGDADEKISDERKAREKLEGHITWLWRALGTGFIGWLFTYFN